MKKVLLSIVLALTFTGCTYTSVTDLEMETINVHVRATDWLYSNDNAGNNYFYCQVDMPEISSTIFNKGEVQAFRVYNKNTSNVFKHILPDVLHCEEFINNQPYFYTTTVDCVYGIGWIEFNYRASDFAYENNININPEAMDFSIVISGGY